MKIIATTDPCFTQTIDCRLCESKYQVDLSDIQISKYTINGQLTDKYYVDCPVCGDQFVVEDDWDRIYQQVPPVLTTYQRMLLKKRLASNDVPK